VGNVRAHFATPKTEKRQDQVPRRSDAQTGDVNLQMIDRENTSED